MHRRQLLTIGMMAGLAGSAWAQQPAPLRVLVGFAPGGSADVVARLLSEKLRDALDGRNVVVENKPGAAGRIAIDALKASPPDGNTVIVMPSGPVVLFPHVFRKLSYDPVKDLTPISQLTHIQFCVVSGPKSNVTSIAEMTAKTKAAKAPASYGTSGNGTLPHFMGLLLAEAAGIGMDHIPYQGGAPAMNALVGGQIDYSIDVVSEALEQHRAGKVRIVAIAGAQRSSLVPEIPTLREQGVALDAGAWYAMYGPAGMAPETVTRLNTALVATLKDPALRTRLQQLGLEPNGSSPSELVAVQKADLEKWAKPVKASGFQLD
jgi:tripartite-type tricarboxylate transporter receptor subunit TctC